VAVDVTAVNELFDGVKLAVMNCLPVMAGFQEQVAK
jgi:hypothetical protein